MLPTVCSSRRSFDAFDAIAIDLDETGVLACLANASPYARKIAVKAGDGAITDPEMNNTWPNEIQEHAVGKVGIFRNDRQRVGSGKVQTLLSVQLGPMSCMNSKLSSDHSANQRGKLTSIR